MWILWILRIHLPQSPTTRTLSGIWDNTPLPGLDLHGRYHYPGAYDHQQPFVQPTEMEVCCTPLTTPPLFSVNTTKVGTILHTQNNGTNTPAPTTVSCHSYPTDVDAFNKVSAVFRKRDSSSSGYLDCKEFWGAFCDLFRFMYVPHISCSCPCPLPYLTDLILAFDKSKQAIVQWNRQR